MSSVSPTPHPGIFGYTSPYRSARWYLGSENEDGSHRRDTEGWPYSIYRRSETIGIEDAVLCHGIQSLSDAEQLLATLNGEPTP